MYLPWPPISLDRTSLDFFLWSDLKRHVYIHPKPETRDQIIGKIMITSQEMRQNSQIIESAFYQCRIVLKFVEFLMVVVLNNFCNFVEHILFYFFFFY